MLDVLKPTENSVFIGDVQLPDGALFVTRGVVRVNEPADGYQVPWSMALQVLDELIDSESDERSGEALSHLLPVDPTDAELLGPTLRAQSWATPGLKSLRLRAVGQMARPENFGLQVDWFKGGSPTKPPRMRGALLIDRDGRPAGRLTFAQFKCLEAVALPPAANEMELRLRVERLLRTIETAENRRPADVAASVEVDPYLARERADIIESISADIVPVASGFQVVPHTFDGMDDAIRDWYFKGGARTGYQRGIRLELKARDGKKKNILLAERALNTVARLRELNVVDEATVARILDDPQEIFGADFDLSGFSPRVKGIGVVSSERLNITSDSVVTGWFTYDAGELPDGAGMLNLSDPAVCKMLLEAIADAKAKGLNWFRLPPPNLVFVPITAKLEARLAEKLKEMDSEETPVTRLGLVVDESSRTGDDEADAIASLGELMPLPVFPGTLNARFKRHQVVGIRWLLTLARQPETGALLADDMGLGKTLQVLAFLSALDLQGRRGPHLVIAPVGLLTNWQQECDRYFPSQFDDLRIVTGRLKGWDAPLGQQSLTLTSYDTVRSNELYYARVAWDVVIIDEAQKIKNPTTQINRVARTLQARFRIAMTGTPVENSLDELWSIMDWAVPGRLGALPTFRRNYVSRLKIAGDLEKAVLAQSLLSDLRPHFLRRLKRTELGSELPDLIPTVHTTSLSEEQTERYVTVLRTRRNGDMPPLVALQRLLGLCAHPDLVDGILTGRLEGTNFPKAGQLFRLLDSIETANEKALIFTGRKLIQDWLATAIRERFGFQPAIINGDISSSAERMNLVEQFSRRPGFRVLVLGPRAAGVGLNITAANHVIHYTREWNPAIEAQATDRAYRMGQKKPVYVHTIVAGNASWGPTVEEKLDELLTRKLEIIRRFVIPVEPVVVSQEELLS